MADATYAAVLENTLGLNRVLKDAYTDANGIVTGQLDRFGNVIDIDEDTIDRTRRDIGETLWLSERRNWVENFSEMMGEWNMGKGLGKLLYSGAKKIGNVGAKTEANIFGRMLTKMERNYTAAGIKTMRKEAATLLNSAGKSSNANIFKALNLFKNTSFKNILKAGRYNGIFGEMAEEYYGIILNHMLGSQELKSDPNKSWLENVSDDIRKQALDITGGIALSTALLGGFGACAHLVSNAQFQLVMMT